MYNVFVLSRKADVFSHGHPSFHVVRERPSCKYIGIVRVKWKPSVQNTCDGLGTTRKVREFVNSFEVSLSFVRGRVAAKRRERSD